jgi:hypothetical protein
MQSKLILCSFLITRIQDKIVIYVKIVSKSFENVAEFRHLGISVTVQNYACQELKASVSLWLELKINCLTHFNAP